MFGNTLRNGLAAASAALAIAGTGVAHAAIQVTLPGVQVLGVDNFCSSFSTSVDPNSGGIVLTCQTTAQSPDAPTGCVATLNGGTSSVTMTSSGGNASLSVTCTSPTTGLVYNWSRNGSPNASTAQAWMDTPAANPLLGANTAAVDHTTSYQVQVCNGAACTTVPALPLVATVPAATTAPPPTGTAWNGTCSGFDNTRVMVMNWANPTRLLTSSYGGFGANDAVVVQFTTGSVASNTLVTLAAAEYGSTPSYRIATLSTTPCDFSRQPDWGANSEGNSVSLPFVVISGNTYGFYPKLKGNTTYYVNIKNGPNANCAANANCNMLIELSKPAGI
jgi:hypothetical protein